MTKQEKIFMKKLEKRISELETENKELKELIDSKDGCIQGLKAIGEMQNNIEDDRVIALDAKLKELEAKNKGLQESVRKIMDSNHKAYHRDIPSLKAKLKKAEQGIETGLRLVRELFDGRGQLPGILSREIKELFDLLKSIRGE